MAVSRRDALKAAMGGMTLLQTQPLQAVGIFTKNEKIPHATRFGPFYGHVQDGVLKEIESQKNDFNPSVMTKGLIDRAYSKSRVRYPCVRKSYLEKKENHKELRGREEFVRVSWDMALDLVAKKLQEIPKEKIYHGGDKGLEQAGRLHNASIIAGRFFNTVLGGVVQASGGYRNGAAVSVNPAIIGDMEVYSLQTTHEEMIANCKVYVMWGADLFKSNRTDFVVPNHLNDVYYTRYKRSGMKFICIDPIYTETAQMFDAEWIKIRPNTDVALMLGMMHYLFGSKKYDKRFISKYTDGFEKFLPYLLGKTDKTPKNAKWAEKITGIPARKIKELAELFTTNRTFFAGNWAMQRAQHGEQVDWALITLASMIGQIGLPGGGVGFCMHYAGGGQASSGYRIPPGISQGSSTIKQSIPTSRLADAILNPGKEIPYRGKKITYPKIDMLYLCGTPLLEYEPNTNELIQALRTLDTIIIHKPWWTPDAKMADIVLPSTTSLERDDITFGGFHSKNVIYAMRKVIEPLYESKNDFDIFAMLANKIGGETMERKYTENKSSIDWIQEFYKKSDGPSFKDFDQFWKEGFVEFEIPKKAYGFVRHADFRKDPVHNKLATKSGKIQIFSEVFASYKLPDFKGHVMWFEPAEWLGGKTAKKYPFHLLSPHPRYRLHSQLENTWIANYYKIQGREPMMINTNDAQRLGVKHGEIVEVYNDRGRILVGAFVSDFIREGVIAIQVGAWYDPEDPKEENPRCNSGLVNILTSSRPTSQMAQATSANTALVNIRKIENEVIKPCKSTLPPSILGV
ncbi:biotin sulfoxide reductase [Helicobacter mustelae]|uniref:molybdopterin-dependent oxidoreductase n=1 Tax=Helicobacter mustelae TaxID=217 RepID=UPI000E01B585|nr:molybdopterin-dependent oxidoreductase [Helicobacter mustelae]STP12993.1 biotin sulfoxide reductase [Helicobacter mustelae]